MRLRRLSSTVKYPRQQIREPIWVSVADIGMQKENKYTQMSEDTFTYTARSTENPDRLATYTLHNGSVSVKFGEAMVEQIEEAMDSLDENGREAVQKWLKPVATGAAHKLLEPIPVTDFNADVRGDTFHATSWIRAGGLRLAPMALTWTTVDNPQGAETFVEEVERRRQQAAAAGKMPGPFDYWIVWVMLSVLAIGLPTWWWQQRQRQSQ